MAEIVGQMDLAVTMIGAFGHNLLGFAAVSVASVYRGLGEALREVVQRVFGAGGRVAFGHVSSPRSLQRTRFDLAST